MANGLELLRRLKKAEVYTEKQVLATKILKNEILSEMEQLLPTVLNSQEEARQLFPWEAIDFIKSLKIRPPDKIKLLIEAICVLRGIKPVETIDKFHATIKIDYWEPAKKVLASKTFIRDLKQFEEGRISRENLKEFRNRFIGNPDFERSKLQRAFPPAIQLYDWLFSIERFSIFAQLLRDKKARYESLEQVRRNSLIDLSEIRRNLKYLIEEIQKASRENRDIVFEVEDERNVEELDSSENESESISASSEEDYVIPKSILKAAKKL